MKNFILCLITLYSSCPLSLVGSSEQLAQFKNEIRMNKQPQDVIHTQKRTYSGKQKTDCNEWFSLEKEKGNFLQHIIKTKYTKKFGNHDKLPVLSVVIWEKILQYFKIKELCTCALVCKKFYNISTSHIVNLFKNKYDIGIHDNFPENISAILINKTDSEKTWYEISSSSPNSSKTLKLQPLKNAFCFHNDQSDYYYLNELVPQHHTSVKIEPLSIIIFNDKTINVQNGIVMRNK